jgi:hypothetical protein
VDHLLFAEYRAVPSQSLHRRRDCRLRLSNLYIVCMDLVTLIATRSRTLTRTATLSPQPASNLEQPAKTTPHSPHDDTADDTLRPRSYPEADPQQLAAAPSTGWSCQASDRVRDWRRDPGDQNSFPEHCIADNCADDNAERSTTSSSIFSAGCRSRPPPGADAHARNQPAATVQRTAAAHSRAGAASTASAE